MFYEVMNVLKIDERSNKAARGDYVISAFAAMIDFAPKTGLWSEFKNLIQINLDSESMMLTLPVQNPEVLSRTP